MLPREEVDQLVLAISEALLAASEGRVPRGYLLLRGGFDRARNSMSPHAAELAQLWGHALARFQAQFPREWYPVEPPVTEYPIQNPLQSPPHDRFQ